MTRSALAVGCAAAAVLLSAVACGTTRAAGPAAAATAPTVTAPTVTAPTVTAPTVTAPTVTAPTATAPGAAATDSGTCPTRSAFATEVTGSGHVAWQVRLPTDVQQQGIVLQPLVIGGVAVFAEENAVYGIRVSDGHQLWRRAFSKDVAAEAGAVYGLWQAEGRVVVLTGQVSASARLTALTPSTGAVRWTLRLPASGLLGSQAQGSDDTLAILRPNGVLESVDLASGRVLWSHQAGQSLGPAAIGPVIAAGSDGRVTGYDGRTGRVLWTAKGLPEEPDVTAVDGVFLAYDNFDTGGVVALNPRTGRAEWRFGSDNILGGGPSGIAFATYTPRRLYLVNPATGRARWSVATFAVSFGDNLGQLLETGPDVVLPEGNVTPPADAFRLVVREAANGRELWSAPLAGGTDGFNLAPLPLAGGRAIAATSVQGTGFPTSTRLTVRRLGTGRQLASVTLPDMIMAPLTVTGTSVLAQSDSPACGTPATGAAATSTR
jgi:outer membrane protein assembly factor BamB